MKTPDHTTYNHALLIVGALEGYEILFFETAERARTEAEAIERESPDVTVYQTQVTQISDNHDRMPYQLESVGQSPASTKFPTHPVGSRVSVRAPFRSGLSVGHMQQIPDGYEGEWFVIEACGRDGDHLLDKSPNGDGRVWIHVDRLALL